ncbi:MAG: PKD domain-containing protein [Methanoregula sp.]|nr:PKD domain-containing protein [Methanoregula sp.]MDD5186811.1 PKD domain-containing protein [Methanoregula sp.]
MNDQKPESHYTKVWILVAFVFFLTLCCILPAAADDNPPALGIIPGKSDISNLAFANQQTGYYYFKFNQVGGGGLNALHIAASSTDLPNFGQVSTTTSQSGTFYITETGGRGYQDNAVLLVAVKGDIPGNFSIHIKSSGYSWKPTGSINTPPSLTQVMYNSGAVDTTFTKSQFVYGSQTWKPAGNNPPADYPLYYGQDMTDTTNTFKLMFVDLKAGPLGANGEIDVSTLTDKGAVKVEYTIENLDTVATFNTYAWNDNTTQGKGISWANRLVGTGCSGYTVLGTNYLNRASEFPTVEGSTPVYHPPDTNFIANVTSGTAPLVVQFTDTTLQSVTTSAWDFGDGSTSTDKNPVHTYASPGKYTVALTAANNQGISATKTQTDYITVTSTGGSPSGSSGGDSGGSDSSSPVTSSVSYRVNFTADLTTGIPPLTVRFRDTTTMKNISRWAWDFTGDNVPDSLEQNPVSVFNKIGNYSVNLTVTTSEGKVFNLTHPAYIRVTETPAPYGDDWISSDQYDAGQDSTGANQQQTVTPVRTTTITSTTPGTSGYSPVGTKVAELLLDALIVVGVIGVGVVLWKKM